MATCLLRDNGVIMSKYLVIGTARLTEGTLELTEQQATPRLHNLKDLGKGMYEIVLPVEFKVGEVIGYLGIPSKSMQEVLEPEQPVEVKPAKKAKEVD